MKQRRGTFAVLFAAVVMTAFAMRAPTGGVGPLMQDIRESLGLSAFAAGFLTTIPLIAFAVTSPLTGKLVQWKSSFAIVLAALLLTVPGLLLRSYGGKVGLFAGTVLLGLGIGVLNVLMPALIRHCFPERIGFMMGVYSTSMAGSSALMSGTCQSIALHFGGWQVSLASPVIFALAAIVLCSVTHRYLVLPRQQTGGAKSRLFTAKRLAIAMFMGLQAFMFFSMLTWFPSIVERNGALPLASGTMLLLLQLCCLLPSLVMPMICQRTQHKGMLACFSTLGFTLGFVLLLVGSTAALFCATVILGLANGATVSLALTFVATQGADPVDTARVSAVSQCVGYALSTVGPSGLGYLYDVFQSWTPTLWCLIVLSVVMALLGLAAGSSREKSRAGA